MAQHSTTPTPARWVLGEDPTVYHSLLVIRPLASVGDLNFTISSILKGALQGTCHHFHLTDKKAFSWAQKKCAKSHTADDGTKWI